MTLLAPRDVAKRLGLSTSRIIQLDREGSLSALRDSAGRRLYDADVVERFALQRAQKRTAQEAEHVPQPVAP
jgi:DNA-binding transcriptional MerR regulator